MRSAYAKDVTRSIRHSLGRFVAIAIIAALGTGFYAGLRMTGIDMYLAADEFYDATNTFDIRVIGTLGLDDTSLEKLAQVEGVQNVAPDRSVDALASIGGVQYAVRIEQLDVDAARASDTSDGLHAVSDDASYINRPLLISGQWPAKADECVLCADAVLETSVGIGDTVTISDVAGDSDLPDVLRYDAFTVTGFVRSPYYPSAASLGNTSLGRGKIDDYLLVPSAAFAPDYPYSGAFLTVEGASQLVSGRQDYKQLVSTVADRVEQMGLVISDDRYATIVGDAQRELDDARADYEREKADAQRELADARRKLDDAAAQLDDAAAQLASARQQVDSGQRELDASAAQLADARAQLEDSVAQYDQGAAALSTARSEAQRQLQQAQQQIDDQRAQAQQAAAQLPQLEAGLQQATEGIAQATATKAQLEGKLAQVEAGIAQLEQQDPAQPGVADKLAELKAQQAALKAGIEQARAGIAEGERQKAQLEAGITQIKAASEQLAQAQAQLDGQRADAEARFATEQARLDDAKGQIDDARAQIAAGQSQLDAGTAKLEDARVRYAKGQRDYAQGLADYEQGLADYNQGQAEADERFADAEAQLADAQAQIDDIENPDWYTLDRTKNTGTEGYRADSDRIDSIAQVFPFIFFLVAALVSLTTMTRMVDEERTLIGTYKALGYSNLKIAGKYLIYVALAGIIGSVAGVLILTQFLPGFIMGAYAIMYQIPGAPTPIDLPLAAGSIALIMGIVLLATWLAVYASLREKPAQLMLPRAPKPGKRILLERIGPLWSRLSFSWKVTARNIFRYKRRFFMVIVGIAGCTALLLTGFGLSNSVNDIIDKQFGEGAVIEYNLTVRTDDIDASGLAAIQRTLQSLDAVAEYEPVQIENMQVTANSDDSPEKRANLVVPQDPAQFDQFVALRPRGHADQVIDLAGAGVVISEKLAHVLDVSVGDTIRLYDEDTIGNAVGQPHLLVVGGITENYVDNYVYATPGAFQKAFGQKPRYDAFLAKRAAGSGLDDGQLAEQLLALDGVTTVSYVDDAVAYYRKALHSVDTVVIVLIVAAAVLAFVVVYNLTNINISERQREIASLKVLGFRRREYISYISRETMVLSVIGGLIGLVLGIFLEGFVITTAEVDLVMFGRDIHLWSFVVSFVLTIVFTGIVMLFMHKKLDRISMVESLKSVD